MFSFRTTKLEDQLDKALVEGRVGCFCTQNCWDTSGDRYMWDIFRERGNLERLFRPEDAELTPGTNHIHFDSESLRGLSAVVVEIQDVGVRYFNYTKDVMRLMMILAVLDEPPALYIVDHFNPAGRIVEGTVPNVDCEKFVPRVAHRHGLTLGELCNLFYSEIGARYPLHVISAHASDYNKDLLPWTIAPASDIPGMFTCMMYAGGGLWNNTNITPGIGTARAVRYAAGQGGCADAALLIQAFRGPLPRPGLLWIPDNAEARSPVSFPPPYTPAYKVFRREISPVRDVRRIQT